MEKNRNPTIKGHNSIIHREYNPKATSGSKKQKETPSFDEILMMLSLATAAIAGMQAPENKMRMQ